MLKDIDITFTRGNDGINGFPLVWIIDQQCLYDIPVWEEYVDMFMNSDEVLDISDENPNHEGITVKFIKNGQDVNRLQTSEYFGSILLSQPTVLDLGDFPYGRYVISPNALFDGEKFIITDRDMSELIPWHPSHPMSQTNDQV